MENYSVLMSVYQGENPLYFRESIQSIMDQTVLTNDFVLVCDGPLTDVLEEVIQNFLEDYPSLFQVIRLKKNLGIGRAANIGLQYCKNDLVAKMDADDIANPTRCEKQLDVFSENPSVVLVGGHIAEFVGEPCCVTSLRKVPLYQDDILSFAKRRMPFNNQTVMYRKSAVLSVGGYSDLRRCEDYDLYIRLLHNGYMAMNIDEPLVYFRLTEDAYKRRGKWDTFAGFVSVRWKMYRMGFSKFRDFLVPCLAECVVCIVPTKMKKWIYEKFLRE
ncbi:MAG: glycosyltransferase [Clostridiales bacterium]|nr:glycosyltransferase [Clostridiales bacterium]